MRGRRKTDDLEKTIPDLPENRRSSKPPAKWRPVLRPSQPPPFEPLNKTKEPEQVEKVEETERQKPKRKLSKQYLDVVLDNTVVQGKLGRVKSLIEVDGAVPTEKNVKTARFLQHNEIAEYLESQIEKAKRIKDSIPPAPSKEVDDAWDDINEKNK